MKQQLFALATASLIALGAYAQTTGPEEMFDRYAHAVDTGDLPALMALHSDDAIVMPNGGGPMIRGKAAIESSYKQLFTNTKSRHVIKVPGNQWQVFGDTAIRTSNGVFEVEGENGKSVLPLRNTYVFHKEGQDWKLVNSHISMRSTQASVPAAAASATK